MSCDNTRSRTVISVLYVMIETENYGAGGMQLSDNGGPGRGDQA